MTSTQKSSMKNNQKFFKMSRQKKFTRIQAQFDESIFTSTFHRLHFVENSSRNVLENTTSNHDNRRRKRIVNDEFDISDQASTNSSSSTNLVNVRNNVIITIIVLMKYRANQKNVKRQSALSRNFLNRLRKLFSKI